MVVPSTHAYPTSNLILCRFFQVIQWKMLPDRAASSNYGDSIFQEICLIFLQKRELEILISVTCALQVAESFMVNKALQICIKTSYLLCDDHYSYCLCI